MNKILIILLIFLTGCTTTKLVEVPVEKTKIEYRDKLIHDSIYVKEETSTKTKNDTVFETKYIYKYVQKTDTIMITKTDSIPKPIKIETVKEVNRLKSWQTILMVIGGISIGLFIGFLIKKLKIL